MIQGEERTVVEGGGLVDLLLADDDNVQEVDHELKDGAREIFRRQPVNRG